jgi:hypothetical protein
MTFGTVDFSEGNCDASLSVSKAWALGHCQAYCSLSLSGDLFCSLHIASFTDRKVWGGGKMCIFYTPKWWSQAPPSPSVFLLLQGFFCDHGYNSALPVCEVAALSRWFPVIQGHSIMCCKYWADQSYVHPVFVCMLLQHLNEVALGELQQKVLATLRDSLVLPRIW